MFTLEAISQAHEKVKTGADFPKYIQQLIALGVESYETYVDDGRIEYFADSGEVLHAPPKYPPLNINQQSDVGRFKERMQLHQQGGSDYFTFCKDAADAGVVKWLVDTTDMTCSYIGREGERLLTEQIPH